ncbi:FecR family protein [Mangrovibacterium diazotrophicum]|uniref:FecR family protein n=1 Tax=Mangrovibacterium diazotrophicum TaxID=1261403 RepID=A0A419VUJ2_9BACT|nr:FecR family protein [Mangrovibacterium diazotrophicum]RKD85132.1 FecR family protein [Mangrovibacterium diazotrophicum]
MKNDEIEPILIKSFAGQASSEEEKRIADWIAASDDNFAEWKRYKALWNKSEALQYSDKINLEKALTTTKKRIPQFRKSKSFKLQWWMQAAAVILLSLIFSVTINYFRQEPVKEVVATNVVYQEVKAAYGTQTKISLEDGTQVWLNSGSKLKFPNTFTSQNTRDVELVGEGYFEVHHNAQQPFIVHTRDLGVKVLGTSFNVNAYENMKRVTVALVEGSVSVIKESKNQTNELLHLKPSEVADYDIEANKIYQSQTKQIGRYTAWKDGKIVFQDDTMEEMVGLLENWYNVDIEVKGEVLLGYHFTATFNDESLDQILKYLSISTSFKYRFVDPKEFGGSRDQRRRIVLYQ